MATMIQELTDVLESTDYERVTADCNTCGVRLFNSNQTQVAGGCGLLAEVVARDCAGHRDASGHNDFDVTVDEKPQTVREIDVTITVDE